MNSLLFNTTIYSFLLHIMILYIEHAHAEHDNRIYASSIRTISSNSFHIPNIIIILVHNCRSSLDAGQYTTIHAVICGELHGKRRSSSLDY